MKKAIFTFSIEFVLNEVEIEYGDNTYVYDRGKFKLIEYDRDGYEYFIEVDEEDLIEELFKELKQVAIEQLNSDVNSIISDTVKNNKDLDGIITFE